jgi:hypothetical protein
MEPRLKVIVCLPLLPIELLDGDTKGFAWGVPKSENGGNLPFSKPAERKA